MSEFVETHDLLKTSVLGGLVICFTVLLVLLLVDNFCFRFGNKTELNHIFVSISPRNVTRLRNYRIVTGVIRGSSNLIIDK